MNSQEKAHHPYDFRSLSLRYRLIIMAIIMVALSVFLIRTLPRALNVSMDYKVIYIASAAWAKGLNPYDHDLLKKLWLEKGESIDSLPDIPSLYPVTTYFILSPLSMLKCQRANIIWIGINFIAILIIWAGLIKIAQLNIMDWPGILMIVVIFALSPVQNCIFQGQPVLLVLCFIVFSILASIQKRDILSGILIGVGLCLKPQIGMFLFLYFIIRRHWVTVLACTLTTLVVAFGAMLKLGFKDFSWLLYWRENLQNASLGINNPTIANPDRHLLLNLQYLLNTIFDSQLTINIVIGILMTIGIVLFLKYLSMEYDNNSVFLEISFLAVISILPLYHRNYDAAILIFPASFGIVMATLQSNKLGSIILCLIFPFFLPGPSLLKELSKTTYFFSGIAESWWWETIVMPHQVWLLLILSFLLLFIMFLNHSQKNSEKELGEEICS